MPPVADERTPWGKALSAALEANARADTDLPDTWYALGSALALDPRSTQNASSWRGYLKRIRKGNPPNEERAVMIADAVGLAREILPDSHQKLTLAGVADDLADAMRHIAKLEKRVESLEEHRSPRAAAQTANP